MSEFTADVWENGNVKTSFDLTYSNEKKNARSWFSITIWCDIQELLICGGNQYNIIINKSINNGMVDFLYSIFGVVAILVFIRTFGDAIGG